MDLVRFNGFLKSKLFALYSRRDNSGTSSDFEVVTEGIDIIRKFHYKGNVQIITH